MFRAHVIAVAVGFVLALTTRIPSAINWPVQDWTYGKPANCKVHRSRMLTAWVPIAYGRFGFSKWSEARYAASEISFPNAEQWVMGGCIEGTATKAIIYQCPHCVIERESWEADHPPP